MPTKGQILFMSSQTVNHWLLGDLGGLKFFWWFRGYFFPLNHTALSSVRKYYLQSSWQWFSWIHLRLSTDRWFIRNQILRGVDFNFRKVGFCLSLIWPAALTLVSLWSQNFPRDCVPAHGGPSAEKNPEIGMSVPFGSSQLGVKWRRVFFKCPYWNTMNSQETSRLGQQGPFSLRNSSILCLRRSQGSFWN